MSITDVSTAVTANSTGIIVTSGTANTKGAWQEMIASTSEETYWVQLHLKGLGADESYLVDLGTGAAASEVVKVANMYVFGNGSFFATTPIIFPLTIPSGTRVSLRCQATSASATMEAMLYLSNDSGYGTSTINETIGAVTGSSKGTQLDPGGTDDTKGGYTQLVASTSDEYNYWLVFLGNNDNPAQTSQTYLVDIGTGATPSAVIDNIMFISSAFEVSTNCMHFFETIASGTKISAQCQSSDTLDATDRLMDIVIIGFKIAAASGGGGMRLAGRGGLAS